MKRILLCASVAFAAVALQLPQIQPKDFAAQLQAGGEKPAIFHVGFAVLYRSKHIPGSEYAGPASQPAGLESLKAAVSKLPKDREIVLYCGCCPWDKCPNMKPAQELLREMGYTHVKALMIPTNFAKDWIDPGYPVELGEAAKK